MHKNVLRNLIHNHPKLEITQMSFNRRVEKRILMYLYKGGVQSEGTHSYHTQQQRLSQKHVEQKKPDTKVLYLIYMTFKNKQNDSRRN